MQKYRWFLFFQWYFYSCLTPVNKFFFTIMMNLQNFTQTCWYLLIFLIFTIKKKWFDKMLTLRQCAANFYVLCQVQNWCWTWSLKEDLTLTCVKLMKKKWLKCYIWNIQPCIPPFIYCPKVFLQSLFEGKKNLFWDLSVMYNTYTYQNTEHVWKKSQEFFIFFFY